MSIQDIQQNPQDTSNFYLANIYQVAIADPNRPNISTPPSPPPFTPPTYAVCVNGLWFLSLMISITCALLATLLQQWARRYLKATQPRLSLHKQARIRSFFAEGVEKSFLPLVVEALPTLLHVSLFLFFAGLVVFLWNVNITIFKMAISWVCVCAAFYGCVTSVPIFRRDSPYYTPLTPLARLLYFMTLRVFLFIRSYFVELPYMWIHYCVCNCSCCFGTFLGILVCRDLYPGQDHWLRRALRSTFMTAEEVALKSSPKRDARAFMWTFDSLDEDHELERFFSSLPNFRSSKVVDDPFPSLIQEEKNRISDTLTRFLRYTLSSDLLPEAFKSQRAIACAKALDLDEFSQRHLYWAVFDALPPRPRVTSLGPIANDDRTDRTIFIQAIATGIAARPRQRDDSWFRQVAPNALGIPETVLRDYAADGDSLSLAILIHATRQQFTYLHHSSWPEYSFRNILEAGSEFRVQDTSPDLQHEFCTLWNQMVLKAQNDNDHMIALNILGPLRKVYTILHQDTDSAPTRLSADTGHRHVAVNDPFSYSVCTVVGHVHGPSPSTFLYPTSPHNNTVPVPPSLASPEVPSLSISAPLHIVKDVPLLDNFHPAQTTIEDLHIPISSASVIRDIGASVTAMPHPTSDSFNPAPISSSPPADSVTNPRSTDLLTCPDSPNLPYSASSSPDLDNMHRTGPSPSFHSPIPRSCLSPSHLRLIIVSTAPSASPGMTFSRDRAIHVDVMAALDPQLQPPARLSTADSDVGIAGISREPTVERTGDRPYDVV